MVSTFKISAKWPSRAEQGFLAQTFARLGIEIGGRNVTQFVSEFEQGSDHLEIPTYYFAEWIAENWWPLLWEPRKNEDEGDDQDFLTRHSTVFAQNGFALPKITFIPNGDGVQVYASARNLQHPDIRFRNSGNVTLARSAIEAELGKFVASVAARLSSLGTTDTDLQEIWSQISSTGVDERFYCQLVGSLGLSPYENHGSIEDLIEDAVDTLGETLALDLCLAADPSNLGGALAAAKSAHAQLSTTVSSLKPLLAIGPPPDSVSLPAWRRGVNGAKKVRSALRLRDDDPTGAKQMFAAMGLDIDGSACPVNSDDDPIVLGLVARDDDTMRIGLTQPSRAKRTFTAARAAYTGWVADSPKDCRFLTLAVTRDQQASRAFAAELTAPIAFIRKRARGMKISDSDVFDMAGELEVSTEVVKNQALNNGLTLVHRL